MSHMPPSYVAKWAVRYYCQEKSIGASVCGLAMLVVALVLGAREMYALCGEVAVLAGGFFGAALQAIRTERHFKD